MRQYFPPVDVDLVLDDDVLAEDADVLHAHPLSHVAVPPDDARLEPRVRLDARGRGGRRGWIRCCTEDQKEKSSPSIQLVAGEPAVPSLVPVQHPQLGAVSSGFSRGTIKVDIDQGPSPR